LHPDNAVTKGSKVISLLFFQNGKVHPLLRMPSHWPELTKRPNFTYRVKIDISTLVEKPQVANFRTTGQTDRVYRTVFKVPLRSQGIDPNPNTVK
jgi:hypothetical protein